MILYSMFSTNKVIFLISVITLVCSAHLMAREESRYRVEVLVLRHLDIMTEPETTAELAPLPEHLDLVRRTARNMARNTTSPQEEGETETGLGDNPLAIAPADETLLPPIGPFPDEIPWAEIDHIESRSEHMAGIWRNLRLSSSYRPEAFLAWEQPGEAPFPLLRIHNEEVASIIDPYLELRPILQSGRYMFQYRMDSGELALAPAPEPGFRYTVDGTARLRRSRFLHVDLDLAYSLPAPGAQLGYTGPPLMSDYVGFQVYPLRQSRQIRAERLEYFDSPALGVLVWVVEIEPIEEDEE